MGNIQAFDQIGRWVSFESGDGDRYLWVKELKTNVISWKKRSTYHFWQFKETARLQNIFKGMADQLAVFDQGATQKEEILHLLKLKQRVKASYKKFYKTHDSILGLIYKVLFAYRLDDHYQNLQEKIARILFSSLSDIDLSQISTKDLTEILETKQKHSTISQFSPQTVADNLSKFELKYLTDLNEKQVNALDFSKLTADQLIHLPSYVIEDQQFLKIDLIHFTKGSISKILEHAPYFLGKFSPQTVADNLSKIELKYLHRLNYMQIIALDFSKLTADQLIYLSFYTIEDNQFLKIDLNNFTNRDISKILENNPDFLKKLSTQTIVTNLSKIDTKYLRHLEKRQVKQIDYRSLTDQARMKFSSYQLSKMKNYPTPTGHPFYGNYHQNFGQRNFNKPSSSAYDRIFEDIFGKAKNFSFFVNGFDDSDENFNVGQDEDEEIQIIDKILDDAVVEINKLNQVHPNPTYEKLRSQILRKKSRDEIKADLELIFVDDLRSFDPDELKKNYRKLSLIFHPDRNQTREKEAEELFKLITAAYNGLLKKYDIQT
jgi:hypothetical protein